MWLYYHNDLSHGTTSLEEIVADFESKNPIFTKDTWIKKTDDLYWAALEYTKEITDCLHWDYMKDKKLYHKVKGSELRYLFNPKLIKQNVHVKLSSGYEWKNLEKVLNRPQDKKFPTFKFHGIASHPPSWRNHLGCNIDAIVYCWIPVMAFALISPHLFVLLLFAEFLGISFLSPFLEACCISIFGYTLGDKISGLRVLTSEGKKLSFSQVFSRKWHINSRYETKKGIQNFFPARELYPFGANPWDRLHGYITIKKL